MRRALLGLGSVVLVTLVLFEAGLGLLTKLGRLPIRAPVYSLDAASNPLFWGDVNPDFGAWHRPGASVRHRTGCFDVTYRANAHGARDVERPERADGPRVVVLGDSFVEGYGVEDTHRFSNVLERETGIPHLNFGTAGHFGTVQYFLLYKTLASRFSHSAVIIGMLPDNDFWENDFEYGQSVFSDRYRPYLVGDSPDYKLVYFHDTLEQSEFREPPRWRRILGAFTYSYNAYEFVRRRLVGDLGGDLGVRERHFFKSRGQSPDPARPYSGYYDFRQDQLDIVKYTFQQVRRLAAGKEVVVVLLPRLIDMKRASLGPPPPLSAELARFAAANDITLVDLLPAMAARTPDWPSYVFRCDGHWNTLGHAVAARLLLERLGPMYRRLNP